MRKIFLYKAIALFMSIIMVGGLLAGCELVKKADAFEPINGKDTIKNYEGAAKTEQLDETYAYGLNKFAYGIFSMLRDGENVFISPYSISSALSMLYNGADKKTREEMAELLGYNLLESYTQDFNEKSNQYMNANSQFLMETLKNADPKVKFDVANSIWLSVHGEFHDKIEASLLAPVRFYYGGDIYNVDFNEDKTLDNVNAWVSDKTKGMIDPFMESFSDKEMLRVFLVNAIYFNGEWSIPFSPEYTRREFFNGKDSSKRVDMMHRYGENFRYLSEKGMRGIEIPYGNERMVMNILIPEASTGKTIGEVYRDFSSEEIELFLTKMDTLGKTEIGRLALPKFEMEYGMAKLNNSLQELGMKKAFQEGEADFSQIGEKLFVSLVGHKAKIRVEEWGTEASAATGIEVNCESAMIQDEPINFIVDVPFIFFIRDTVTGTILFMGEMNQPE